ncbi:sensor histidine kinase/response regulator [Thermothelomyces heterothallicus CBS 203.75]
MARKRNHTYATANNGLGAVQLYKKSLERQAARFSLVFMDISMPVVNGFEATKEMRQLEIAAGVPPSRIVALTGLRSDVNRDEAVTSGSDLFLTKPN